MEAWLSSLVRPIADSFVYAILGTAILCLTFWFIEKILPFSMKKEIEEDENTSLGIILGAFIIGISLIIAAAIQG